MSYQVFYQLTCFVQVYYDKKQISKDNFKVHSKKMRRNGDGLPAMLAVGCLWPIDSQWPSLMAVSVPAESDGGGAEPSTVCKNNNRLTGCNR